MIKKSIEDDRENYTRFFLAGTAETQVPFHKTGSGKAIQDTVVFTTRNTPGASFRSLSAFALRDLNLTKIDIEAAAGETMEYLFYLDFIGHAEDPAAVQAEKPNLDRPTE